MNAARETVEWYKKVFGDDFYLELQRHEVKDPTLVANRDAFPLQQKVNRVLLQFAKEYNIKYVCTNDCHFEDKETAEAQRPPSLSCNTRKFGLAYTNALFETRMV